MKISNKFFNINILFVEFNQDYIKSQSIEFDSLVNSMMVVRSKKDAIEAVKHNNIDLIVTDIYLEDDDTFTMLKEIHTILPYLPAIIITPLAHNKIFSYISEIDRKHSYIKEPIDRKELIKCLENTLQTLHDFHQEQKAENLLQQYKIVLNNITNVLHFDKDYNITDSNKLFEDLLGYTKEELKQEKIHSLMTIESNPTIYKIFFIKIEQNEIIKKEVIFKDKNNNFVHVYISISAILNVDKSIKDYILVAIDITDLVNKTNEAKRSQKAKEMFLANMSHEMRTPLNGIVGYAKLLQNLKLSNKANEFAKIISKSSFQLLDLINQLLDLSKIQSGSMDINLNWENIIKEFELVKQMLSPIAEEKDVILNWNIDISSQDMIFCDALRIKQILVNLVNNALKFTNTKVDVNIKLVEKNVDNLSIKFHIVDDGIGISSDEQKKIVKPFLQADENTSKKYGGTGLGLSIVTELLQLMNSRLSINSVVGEGSDFSFVLKFAYKEDEKKEIDDDIDEFNSSFDGLILVAEDSEINQMLIKDILEIFDLEPVFAFNGQKAVEFYMQNYKKIDLILMDINMPILDGIEATKQIRKFENTHNIKATPIVALTANAIIGDKEKYLESGMQDYMSKPFDMNDLHQLLKKYLKEKKSFDLRRTSKNLGISEEKIMQYIQRLILTLDNDLPLLKKHIQNYDYEDIRQISHRLKGTTNMLGLDNLQKLFALLEQKSKEKKSDNDYILILEKIYMEKSKL